MLGYYSSPCTSSCQCNPESLPVRSLVSRHDLSSSHMGTLCNCSCRCRPSSYSRSVYLVNYSRMYLYLVEPPCNLLQTHVKVEVWMASPLFVEHWLYCAVSTVRPRWAPRNNSVQLNKYVKFEIWKSSQFALLFTHRTAKPLQNGLLGEPNGTIDVKGHSHAL